MKPLTKEFENELGNSIKLQVSSKEINKIPGVEISISGPDSISENHITLVEAKILYDLLGQVLKDMDTHG